MEKGGKISVQDGVAKLAYAAQIDGDTDGRAMGGVSVEAFIDLPELLQEMMKDSKAAQVLAQWLDANKSLLPAVEKEI